MITLSIKPKITATKKLNFREKIVETIKVWLVIKPLQNIFKNSSSELYKKMKGSPEGTVGHDLFLLLEKHQLSLIPHFENHDLKHLILNYNMSSIDEIKMQAYLLGNGNHSIYCLLFVASGILFPNEWRSFFDAYKKGRHAPSIINLSIHECLTQKTEDIKRRYNT